MTSSQSDGISVVAIPALAVPYYWEAVQPQLQRAVDITSGEVTTDDIYTRLIDKRMQLLVVTLNEKIIAAGVTEVIDYPQFRKFRISYLAGDRIELWAAKLSAMLEAGARAVGAKEIEAYGRRGWARFFNKDSSVKERYCVMTREVEYDS